MSDEEFDATLTEEELATESIFEWSNETLGRLTRHLADRIAEIGATDLQRVAPMSAALMLVWLAEKTNAGRLTVTLNGTTTENKPTGDWRVTVSRINKKKDES